MSECKHNSTDTNSDFLEMQIPLQTGHKPHEDQYEQQVIIT